MASTGPSDLAPTATSRAAKRILVVFEPGRAGVAAVEHARDLAERQEAAVTVVALAPQAPVTRGCLPSACDYNAAVCDSVTKDLERAEEMLWCLGPRADCRPLVERCDPPLEQLVADEQFDLVLLPAHRRRLLRTKHPAAAAVARAGAEVRIVSDS